MKTLIVTLIVAVFIVACRSQPATGISAAAARERLKQGALLIDVRTGAEFAAGHLPNAVNIPLAVVSE